jgi:hypothetical protein
MKNIIIFHKADKISIIPAILLSILYPVYYVNIDKRSLIIKYSLIKKFILPIPIETVNNLSSYINHTNGDPNYLYSQAEIYLNKKCINGMQNYFPGVSKLYDKVQTIFVTNLIYDEIGLVVMCFNNNPSIKKIFFIHSTFRSFFLKENGNKNAKKYIFLILPSTLIISLLNKVKSFFLINKNKQIYNLNTTISSKKNAILFHTSTQYGNLFKKDHYFSKLEKSALNIQNLLLLVLNKAKINYLEESNIIKIIPFEKQKVINSHIYFKILLKNIFKLNNFKEIFGLFLFVEYANNFKMWCKSLEQYPALENVIIDYDILFPKELSLALESNNIKTISFQERPIISYNVNFGLIMDTYFSCGGIYHEYVLNNKSIICNKIINFGQWRTNFLSNNNTPIFSSIQFLTNGYKLVDQFEYKITCFGYFLDTNNSETTIFLNQKANLNFFENIKILSLKNKKCAFIIRMKLNKLDLISFFNIYFSESDNVFLCNDYSKLLISYTLCKNSNFIISLQSSIADECLASGIPVILIDYTHNLSNILSDVLPEPFHFLIAKNTIDLLKLFNSLISKKYDIMIQYINLKNLVKGSIENFNSNTIPESIENIFKNTESNTLY